MLYKENSYLWGMKNEVWHIERYSSQRKVAWDDFVKRSKNATFLFFRDYMDYHADRFQDASLLIYRGDSLVAFSGLRLTQESIPKVWLALDSHCHSVPANSVVFAPMRPMLPTFSPA